MTEPASGRGWAAVLGLSLLTATLSVVHPALLIFVPLAVLLLALPPRRPAGVAVAALIVAVFFWTERGGSLWYFERGWALILSAWFVVAVVAMPRSGFLSRALAAVAASVASAGVLLIANPRGFDRIDQLIGARLRASGEQIAAVWRSRGFASRLGADMPATLDKAVGLQSLLFPALLALASLAGLAVAWWAFRRLVAREGSPLAPLREFRFNDGLVWLLVAGGVLLLAGAGYGIGIEYGTSRAGSNLLLFTAALYALRGLAVLLVIGGAPGPVGLVLGGLLLLLLYPLVMATTFFVGLTDTWLDIRTRRRAPPPRS